MNALRESRFVDQLINGELQFEWATTKMISDDPAKGLGRAAPEKLFPQQLKEIVGQPIRNFELVSAYFVPSAHGAHSLVSFAKGGVQIRVLTNAFEATDVPAVHAGYVKRRKELLQAGIRLYELRRASNALRNGKTTGIGGSSGSSLHAKTFSVDGSRVFIGSFNFDPRSAKLNTELGFVIDSPALAQQVQQTFDARVPQVAYEVRLSDTGHLYWIEQRKGRLVRYDTEPGTTFWSRAFLWFLSRLPIESLL
jgi:cardiolipin synthase C